MFEVGEYVVYGNKGVCKIKSVGPINMPGISSERLYYTLTQVFLKGSTIFTPVDNIGTLRRILTKEEAKELIEDIKNIKPEWNRDDKARERYFTESLKMADSRELSKMIISLYHRKEERLADGKKATSTDERYFHAAEDILLGELSVALGKDRDEIRDYIGRSIV
jgi:CarD family transcriptional regulator